MSDREPPALEITRVEGALRFRLRVSPGASSDQIRGTYGGALKVAVTAAPERGKANAAVCKLLAKALGVSKSAVVVVAGETSPDKTVEVRGEVDAVKLRALATA